MFLRSLWSLSNVFTTTRSARVESRPPEMPITAVSACVWANRCANPVDWMAKISSQQESSLEPDGTNGRGLTALVRLSADGVCGKAFIVTACRECSPRLSANVVLTRRSFRILSTSISPTVIRLSMAKRSPSAIIEPLSQIIEVPAKTTSVVDSPNPQEENTYPAMHLADCCFTRFLR